MDDRELAEATAQLEAKRADQRANWFSMLQSTVSGGSDAYIYRSIYLPVDSIVDDEPMAEDFDVSLLQVVGLSGWEMVGVVPKTLGVGLKNTSVGSSFGTTWGAGMGGNVIGVYLLLRFRVHASNLAASETQLAVVL